MTTKTEKAMTRWFRRRQASSSPGLWVKAGADPIVVMLTQPGLDYLLAPVAIGSILLVLFAAVFHRLPPKIVYPLKQ